MPARRRRAASAPASPPPVVLLLDPVELLPWSRAIARGVRSDYQFRAGSHEEQELEGVAALAVVELCIRYDEARLPPTGDLYGAFRGWADGEVRSRCRRAAVRLRNAGTFVTTANPEARKMVVEGLPVSRCENCTEVLLRARDVEEEPDEPEPVTSRHEPRLVILRNGAPTG